VSDAKATSAVRVMVVGAYEVIARGLEAMVAPFADRVRMVGNVGEDEDPLARAKEAEADVVLIDLRLRGGGDGLEVAGHLAGQGLPFRVGVFTNVAEERRLFEALRRDLAGYLLYSLSASSLIESLERMRAGEVVVDPSLASRVALAAAHRRGDPAWPGASFGLSYRESQVLGLLVEGMANRDIAERLEVGEETVKSHLRSVYRKLGVADRARAVTKSLREGIYG
jgi:DNA-binding NarL/FixJ family response regulator